MKHRPTDLCRAEYRVAWHRRRHHEPLPAPAADPNGYWLHVLHDDGSGASRYVHRSVVHDDGARTRIVLDMLAELGL